MSSLINHSKSILYKLSLAIFFLPLLLFLSDHSFGPNSPEEDFKVNQYQTLQTINPKPLVFEQNLGQMDDRVKFLSRAKGYDLFLQDNGVIINLKSFSSGQNPQHPIEMKLAGANNNPKNYGQKILPGKTNYLVGNDKSKWRSNIPNYAKVKFEEVYNGIDVVFYGTEKTIEFDFLVSPGVAPENIKLEFEGPDKIKLDKKGNLVMSVGRESMAFQSPILYQEKNGEQIPIKGEFALLDKNQIGFTVGDYDPALPLVIDPVLIYSTYIGGNGHDSAQGIHVDDDGNMIVIGATGSTDFPVGVNHYMLGAHYFYVTKLLGNGSDFEFTSFLGGRDYDVLKETAIDADGNIYLAGYTESDDFPTDNAHQNVLACGESSDIFVSKLKADGSGFVYSTYLGGCEGDGGYGRDEAHDLTVDVHGNAYITGRTNSVYFDTTAGAFQTKPGFGEWSGYDDAIISKFDANGTLVYSTFLGSVTYPTQNLDLYADEIGTAIAVDNDGSVYVAGLTNNNNFYKTEGKYRETREGANPNIFITKLNPQGSDVLYSTFFGGSEKSYVYDMMVSDFGHLILCGYTDSQDFPTTASAFQRNFGGIADLPPGYESWSNFAGGDAFITSFLNGLDDIYYSTYLGGSARERVYKLAGDDLGSIYATGLTFSQDFPTTDDALQDTLGGLIDPFVLKITPTANGANSLVYSTYFGGKNVDGGNDINVDKNKNLYLAGWTRSDNLLVSENALQDTLQGDLMPDGEPFGDAFVAKIGRKDYIRFHWIYPDPQKDLWLPHTLRPGEEWQFNSSVQYALFASNRGTIDIVIEDDKGNRLDTFQIQNVPSVDGLAYNDNRMNKIIVPEIEESDSLFVKAYLTPDNHATPIDSAIVAYKIIVHKWTFMVYMNGDGNLEYAAFDDYLEMGNVGSNDSLAIVLLFDRHPNYLNTRPLNWADSRYIALLPNNQKKFKSMGELDMGSPQTLNNFIKWGRKNFPAEHFALVLWDHGGGWMAQNKAELKKLNPAPQFPISLPGMEDKYESSLDFGPDETSYNKLTSIEIKRALTPLPKLDILFFNTCVNAMIENAFQFHKFADYFVASEDIMPLSSMPYTIFFNLIKQHPDMTPAEVAKWIVESYGASYSKDRKDITMSATLMYKVEQVKNEVNHLAELLIEKQPWAAIDSALIKTHYFPPLHYRDLYSFVESLKPETNDPELVVQCDRVMGSLYDCTTANYASRPEQGSHGLSIYFPTAVGAFNNWYIEPGIIQFAEETLWDEFLILYLLRKNLPPGVEGPVTDTYEVNDTFTQAYGPLESDQVYLSYIPYAGDTDFYYFTTGQQTPAFIKLTSPVGINYDLNVLDANQQIIAFSNSSQEVDSLYISNLQPGSYYLEIVTNDNFFEYPYKLELDYNGSGIGQVPLSFDDGLPDGGQYADEAGEVIGSNFRAPTYPMKLDEISFFINSTDGANSGGDGSFYVWLADYYGTKTDPFKVTPSGVYTNSSAMAGGWFTVDLSDKDINLQTDFFIGMGYDGENTPVLGMDNFDDGRTFQYDDSTQSWQAVPGTAFIRAKVSYLESPHTASFLMPEVLYGLPGQAVSVPLNVSNLNGSTVDSLQVDLTYDVSILELDFISFGNSISSDWTITGLDTSLTGRISISTNSGTPITTDETLLSANFQVKSNAVLGDSGQVLLERLVANGGQLYTITRNTKIFISDGSLVSDKKTVQPQDFELYQNYPNPFNPTTNIEYQIPKPAQVRITISDMLGRHIKTLVNSNKSTGNYTTMWNATDENNRPVAAGLYFAKMEAGDFSKVVKLALVR